MSITFDPPFTYRLSMHVYRASYVPRAVLVLVPLWMLKLIVVCHVCMSSLTLRAGFVFTAFTLLLHCGVRAPASTAATAICITRVSARSATVEMVRSMTL